MALVIMRIFERSDGVTRTKFPELYDDRQQAVAALQKILEQYPYHGIDEEEGW